MGCHETGEIRAGQDIVGHVKVVGIRFYRYVKGRENGKMDKIDCVDEVTESLVWELILRERNIQRKPERVEERRG
jgi:hypothetical protein